MNNLDITVIIPLHSVKNEKTNEYLTMALNSIKNNATRPSKVMIVRCGCGDVKEFLDKFDFTKFDFTVDIVENISGKSFQNQMNYAVSKVETKYFSLLEFDDEYSTTWFKNVDEYIQHNTDVDMFLPIVSDVDEQNRFLMLTNEAVWAYNFTDELGFLDNESLINYPNINIDGMVISKQSYQDCGGLKPSIKLSFNYEFLLRYTRSGYKVMVIPKIGYKHTNMRTDSLFWSYKNDPSEKISPDEAKFWMDLAQKEFYYKDDRNIIYAPVDSTTAVISNG